MKFFTDKDSSSLVSNITSNLRESCKEQGHLYHDSLLVPDDSSSSSIIKESSKLFIKLRILKNLLVICFSILFAFTAYEALMNLQSTINPIKNVGTYALAIVYASSCVSSFTMPAFLINRLGCKTALVISLFAFSPYIAANFYPGWWTFVPTAALCGTAAGPLWAARSTYINELSSQYASYVTDSTSVITVLFFGISCMSYQSSQILGNLISYYVLKPRNDTFIDLDVLSICGSHFCNKKVDSNSSLTFLNPNLEPPTTEQRYVLIGIFVICSLLAAVIIWIFLDSLQKGEVENKKYSHIRATTLFLAMLKQAKKKKQFLLLPLTFHLGLSDGFLFSDFTKAYVACAWKIYHVSYVMIAYGTTSALMSVVVAILIKYFGRTAVFLSSGTVNMIQYALLLVWTPDPDHPIFFFFMAAAWGYADAVWWGQIMALHGVLFKDNEEAAFSNFSFWNGCGFLVAYAYDGIFCTNIKIYILISILLAGMIGYLTVEYSSDVSSLITKTEKKSRTKESSKDYAITNSSDEPQI